MKELPFSFPLGGGSATVKELPLLTRRVKSFEGEELPAGPHGSELRIGPYGGLSYPRQPVRW